MKIKQKETNQNSIILVDFLLDRFHTFWTIGFPTDSPKKAMKFNVKVFGLSF